MSLMGFEAVLKNLRTKRISPTSVLVFGLASGLLVGCGGGGGSSDQTTSANTADTSNTETLANDTTATETDDNAQLTAAVSVTTIAEQSIFGGISVTVSSVTEQNIPIEGATVNLNQADTGTLIATQTTDSAGNVSFSNLPAGTFYILEINHPDYVVKAHLLDAELAADTTTNLELAMLRRADPVVFNEDQGGTITAGTAQIILPPNAFVSTESDNAVVGDVTAYITPIDPTNPDHMAAYPGTLMAVSNTGGDRELYTYGVYDIDFYNSDQEYLTLGEGITAELVLPLFDMTHEDGSEIVVGDSIPLWRLNEQNGKWVYESDAIVEQGDSGLVLRGTGSGFSAYNMDRPTNRNYWNVLNIDFDLDFIEGADSYEGSRCLAVKYYHRHGNSNTHYSDDVVCIDDVDYKQHYALRNGWISQYCWDFQVLQPGVTTFNWNNQNVVQSAGTTNMCWTDPYASNACQHLSGNSVLDANHCGSLSDHIGFNLVIDLVPDGIGNYDVSVSSLQEGLRLNDPSVTATRANLR